MAAKNDRAAGSADREFVISRVFDAPRALVFETWTNPSHMAAWWGPHGFAGRCEMDVRPGGTFRITMLAPDGSEYPMRGVYREIEAPARLVYTSDLSEHPDSWHDLVAPERDKSKPKPAYESLTTVTFEEQGKKTLLTVRTIFESAAIRDLFVKIGMNGGWSQSLQKLEALLIKSASTSTADREIVATRLFDAPRALVWKLWTDPEHIARWWGPNGFRSTIDEMDVRPGGVWQFTMHGPDGVDYPNKNIYLEIIEPERIVFTHVSEPQHHLTATFADEGKQTRLTVQMLFKSAADRDKVAEKFGAVEGLSQTLGRLGEELAKMR
jgi:uncharacterized protein YndB with AHSA1/START domain